VGNEIDQNEHIRNMAFLRDERASMSVRSFEWRDLPALYRSREHCAFLYTSLLLTRGPWVVPSALFTTIFPVANLHTSVSYGEDGARGKLFGQMMHNQNVSHAHLTFLTPDQVMDAATLSPLLEHLTVQAVQRGALRLLAEIDERAASFEALRQMGFSIYARQRVWRYDGQKDDGGDLQEWRTVSGRDLASVRSLYNNLMPGLVQQVEPFPASRLKGLVFHQGGELLAYVELKYGHRGIWVQPFVHPDAEGIIDHLTQLLMRLPSRRSRPVYICIRSYQSWLESAVESLGARPGPRQAVMAKHLAITKKVVRTFTIPAIEGGRPEITAPFTQSHNGKPPHAADDLIASYRNTANVVANENN
jgi:hypothetical protein